MMKAHSYCISHKVATCDLITPEFLLWHVIKLDWKMHEIAVVDIHRYRMSMINLNENGAY